MSGLRRLYDRATAGPDYPPSAGDLADVRVFGVAIPARASIATFTVTALILVDTMGVVAGRVPAVGSIDPVSLQRFVLFLVAPLLVVLLVFRDKPGRYGLRLGDWRWGVALLVAGLAVMTPIILGLSALGSFRDYYGGPGPFGGYPTVGQHVVDNAVELLPAEFLLRGFLMFALWRRIGPLALVVVQVPFVLTHIGKPDVELWSTFVGGSVFAWLDWRTGSILWSALGHVYVLTLMVVAVGGASTGG